MSPSSLLKSRVRRALHDRRPEVLYPQPVISLQPERLYSYLDALNERVGLNGDVVEVGIWLGGTTSLASRFLDRLGFTGKYVCVDTFDGFVPAQFDYDSSEHGVPSDHGEMFDGNSQATVRRLLKRWGVSNAVEFIEGDVATLAPERLPAKISVCLLDVDLDLPIYEGLRTLVPRLVPGGILLVDDCPPETSWAGAKAGYERFMKEVGVEPEYVNGFGVIHAGPQTNLGETSA